MNTWRDTSSVRMNVDPSDWDCPHPNVVLCVREGLTLNRRNLA